MPQEYYVFAKNRDEHAGYMDGCILWWRAGGKGYTYDLNFAGVFTDEDRARRYPPDDTCVYVLREIIDQHCSYSPRLAYWSRSRGGESCVFDELAKLALGDETLPRATDSKESGTASAGSTMRARSNEKR